MSTKYVVLNKLIKYLQPHWWTGIGQFLMALAILYRPRSGAPYALFGTEGSGFIIGIFLAGAVLSISSRGILDYNARTLAYMFALLPFVVYCVIVLYLFIVVRGLNSESVTLTTPLAYAGLVVMSVINYVLMAQLEFVAEHGVSYE
jgi:hypothetical protein